MDIGSRNGYPAGTLSNFSPHKFIFRGIECNSMEGLLQSFKFKNPEMQKEICKLVGIKAKNKGRNKNWYRTQTLYWQGQEFNRHSKMYQDLLDEAFYELFTQNISARNALISTRNATLTHSIGKNNESETVLTEREFISRLTKIRNIIQNIIL